MRFSFPVISFCTRRTTASAIQVLRGTVTGCSALNSSTRSISSLGSRSVTDVRPLCFAIHPPNDVILTSLCYLDDSTRVDDSPTAARQPFKITAASKPRVTDNRFSTGSFSWLHSEIKGHRRRFLCKRFANRNVFGSTRTLVLSLARCIKIKHDSTSASLLPLLQADPGRRSPLAASGSRWRDRKEEVRSGASAFCSEPVRDAGGLQLVRGISRSLGAAEGAS